jgi:hypothetical protein
MASQGVSEEIKRRSSGRLEDWRTGRERSTARNGIAGFMQHYKWTKTRIAPRPGSTEEPKFG